MKRGMRSLRGFLGPGNDLVVEAAVVVLADAFFGKEFAGEAEVDGAGLIELFEVFL